VLIIFFDEYSKEKFNTDVFSLDISEKSLGDKHDLGVVADARSLPFNETLFDLVISNASMPHLFAPYIDSDGVFIQIEGDIKKNSLEDILQVFRESYRVIKNGGQIRMSTFSEERFQIDVEKNKSGKKDPWDMQNSKQQLDRTLLLKEALEIFEQESGARCIFKDKKGKGLIIIMKPA
jgi:SAM-dependent methyltransferase